MEPYIREAMASIQRVFILVLALAFLGCSTISNFDQAAYEHATSAKVDALVLMSKATDDYSSHTKQVEALMIQLDKAYEYDRGRQLNRVTIAQWDILRDPNRDLLGGFLKMWKAKGTLSATFVEEKKKQIADAFDQIIQLESGKLKRSQLKD
jgi:hypothetical protein